MKVSVYIATSLDGVIARTDGSLDWLDKANATIPNDEDSGILLERYKGQEKHTLVLDLGCGTGLLSNILVSKGLDVIGMDISLESLRLLQQRETRINTIQADATLLPFADGSCHIVASLGAWRHFSDLRRVIAEVARILIEDGLLIVSYFPPAIGGVIRQGDSHWRQLLVRLYQFLIRKQGYVDHVDLKLEPMTVRWVEITLNRSTRWTLVSTGA
ncbi:MAG: methyltransferase domain-containing protein [Xanthomonadales bacterium]|nr:methyltransferase domain-containing protein [Xanthomonadales bacterium]